MLQLQAKPIDICRISKILVRYNIKASISNSTITLSGDISDELLTQLCNEIKINTIQNFISNDSVETISDKNAEYIQTEIAEKPCEVKTTCVEKSSKVNTTQPFPTLSHNLPAYNLIYPKVKRGEVYLCDFGDPYGSEQGNIRPAIIIQNDIGNSYSPTTIIVACTSENKRNLPTHYKTLFSAENMVDFNSFRFSMKETIIMAEQIQTIDKTRLRKYIGTLTSDFMEIIEDKIDISLQLNRKVKTIIRKEKVYVDRPKAMVVETGTQKERKDVNMLQIQLLSFVDIKELIKISQSKSTDDVKAQKILSLFGFNLNENGVQYLLKAIIASPKNDYFNLETLSETISQTENIDKDEIKRLIVARVKETFGFKKAPTIDFIRLVNNFLIKQEVNYEKINI